MLDLDILRKDILSWLESLDPERSGRFPFSKTGAIYQPSEVHGLGSTSFVSKIVYTLDANTDFPTEKMSEFLLSFQGKTERWPEYFEDQVLLSKVDGFGRGRYRLSFFPLNKLFPNQDVRRAETRQAIAALRCLGKISKKPMRSLYPNGKDDVQKYWDHLNWENPWAAGSHFSHAMFFLRQDLDAFQVIENESSIEQFTLLLSKIYQADKGGWFVGQPSENIIVNGIMKVLTGLQSVPTGIRSLGINLDAIVDRILKYNSFSDACHVLNAVYILWCCTQQSDFRKVEVEQYLKRILVEEIPRFRMPDGAFSFYPKRAQNYYYGLIVTKGLAESDVHGTHLLTWTLAMIGEILNLPGASKWRVPVT